MMLTTTRPTTSYIICASQRSGSTLLCEALRNTGLAGSPGEYFWRDNERKRRQAWGSATYAAYLAHLFEHTMSDNGVFGAKIMWGYWPDFMRQLRRVSGGNHKSETDSLTAVFPNLHFITISRQNKVRQAISLYRAVETQQWSVFMPAVCGDPPPYCRAAIHYWRQEILRQENGWQRFFEAHKIQPYTVVYEELVGAYEATALDILRFLDVPIPRTVQFGPRHLRRQADELTDRWERRFRQAIS